MSVLGAAPARDDTILMAQCDVTIRILTRRRVVRRITDAGIGGYRDNLLNRGACLVPNFDFVRQIVPIRRNWPSRNATRDAIFAVARRLQAQRPAAKRCAKGCARGCDLEISTGVCSHRSSLAGSQSMGTVNRRKCWLTGVGTGRFTIAINAPTIKQCPTA
jgi:hypothetical protein